MRVCAPRTRGRGDPCTQYKEERRCCASRLLELFIEKAPAVIALGAMTASRLRAYKLPNRDEVPHPVLPNTGCRGHSCRGCGARRPAFNFIACARSRGVGA